MNDEATLDTFFSAWELFADSALAGTIAGALLGFLGVYIVLRRMVFLSAALSQTAGLGVTLAFYAQLHLGVAASIADPTLGATLVTFIAIVALMTGRQGQVSHQDRHLGLVFLIGAAGTLIVGTQIVQELQDVETLLFGTAVAVLPEDFRTLLIVALVISALHVWWWRGFAAVATDADSAQVRGLPTRLLELVLLLTLAIAISVCTRILGALPTFAFSVLPAMATLRLLPNAKYAMVGAALVGAACGFGGYVAAFMYDWPVGASQTVLGAAVVIVAAAADGTRRLGRRLV